MRSRHSPLAWALFDAVFLPWMRSRIAGVHLAGLPERLPAGAPLLVCANHTSWWDGFLVRRLQRALRPGRPLYTVMLEQELGPRPFLRWLGALGITPGSLSSVRSALRFLSDQRARTPELMLSFFPQGRIWPSGRRPLGFQPGVRLFVEALAPVRILPLAMHLEPGTRAAPAAYLSAGALLDPEDVDVTGEALERHVTAELDAIAEFLNTHGERAPEAWPRANSARLPSSPRGSIPFDAPKPVPTT